MKHLLTIAFLWLLAAPAFSQSPFPKNELSVNAFRNPSIGLEYHRQQVSVHAGYYTTAFKSGEYTNFVKTGLTYWVFPVDKKKIPSSFYAGASYLRGLTRDYKDKNAAGIEAGFRWMIWQGLNVRIGAIALMAKGQDTKFNPTPGLGYSFAF
ncbi:MAG: hypothetical protein INR73_06310 [Williamsia sp.]|nr:hypothetical protein [Williamsia sp.]